MSITITNMRINVYEPLTTQSWRMTALQEDGRYAIDTIRENLQLSFECTYPCLTCDTDATDVCDSCNSVNGFNILYEKKCYQTCPDGSFFEYFQCKECDENCKTCSKYSGIQCTSCKQDSSAPYLNGNACSWTCDFGFFGNRETGLCEPCTYPCESCVETSTTCLSCN
jgi:proprotein convertase subtilisin/kexin type 5